ncbi:hypothetical protein L9F63_010000, partial [Diploptera punctata]
QIEWLGCLVIGSPSLKAFQFIAFFTYILKNGLYDLRDPFLMPLFRLCMFAILALIGRASFMYTVSTNTAEIIAAISNLTRGVKSIDWLYQMSTHTSAISLLTLTCYSIYRVLGDIGVVRYILFVGVFGTATKESPELY